MLSGTSDVDSSVGAGFHPFTTEDKKLDFGFSEEQEMLRDAAKRFLADNCSTKFVRQMMAHDTAHDQDFWQKLVGQGWPGLLIPEQYGGANGTFLDMTVVVEEMGKALIPGPFFAAALMGAPALLEGGSDALKKEFLPKIAGGKFIATLALAEAAGRFDAGGVELKATRKGAGYTLNGEKFFVPDAHVADAIIVATRTDGAGENGITLLCVPANEKGITVTQLKTVDMTRRMCTSSLTTSRRTWCSERLTMDGRSCSGCSRLRLRVSRRRWLEQLRRRWISRSSMRRRECSSVSRLARSRLSSISASI